MVWSTAFFTSTVLIPSSAILPPCLFQLPCVIVGVFVAGGEGGKVTGTLVLCLTIVVVLNWVSSYCTRTRQDKPHHPKHFMFPKQTFGEAQFWQRALYFHVYKRGKTAQCWARHSLCLARTVAMFAASYPTTITIASEMISESEMQKFSWRLCPPPLHCSTWPLQISWLQPYTKGPAHTVVW